MKITKNELIEIIKEEARALVSERETTATDIIRVALGNKQLLQLLPDDASKVISSVKEGPQVNLLIDLITNALKCHDEADVIKGKNQVVCTKTKLNPDISYGMLADTYNEIKNFKKAAKVTSDAALGALANQDSEPIQEAKNCGCGQDPCKTYGALEENKVKMTKSKLQQIILEETKLALEGDVPGRISGGDLVAAITLAIDEVFQESRPDHEAAAIAYAQISHSLDEIFKQSYKAAARAGKMMGGNPDEPGDLGGLGL